MSCFAGATYDGFLTLETWHEIDSFFDSQDGKSPLMQLCRVCQQLRDNLDRSAFSFARVGASPTDVAWAAIDYEGHPEWSPLTDYATILGSCHAIILEAVNSKQANDDCEKVRYAEDAALAAYLAYVSGRNINLKSDWLTYILGIRTFLESVSVIEADPWTTRSAIWFLSGTDPALVNSGIYGMFEPGSVVPYTDSASYARMLFGKTGHSEYNLHSGASYGCGKTFSNLHYFEDPHRYYDAGDGFTHPGANSVIDLANIGAGFRRSIYVLENSNEFWTQRSYNHLDAGAPIALYCDNPLSDAGWWQTNEVTRTFYISRSGTYGFVPGEPHATDGYEVQWKAVKGAQPNPARPIISHFSVDEGSFTWDPGEVYREITITHYLDDVDMGPYWPENKSLGFSLQVLNSPDTFCEDACGNLYPKE